MSFDVVHRAEKNSNNLVVNTTKNALSQGWPTSFTQRAILTSIKYEKGHKLGG